MPTGWWSPPTTRARRTRTPSWTRSWPAPAPAPSASVDRREAIAKAIGTAADGDVVVIAGKGHEQGQEFEDGRKEPFDDVQVAREALRELS